MQSDSDRVKAEKGLLREQMRESIETLSDAAKAQESERIAWVLEGLLRPPREECIAVYFPLGDEPDITPLIEAMLRTGQSLCAPRIEKKHLVMHRFSSLNDLQKSPFGNLEPEPDTKPESNPSFVLVPGVAFDREKNRLGRGLGFYDHYIAEQRKNNPRTEFLGVCFSCQLLESIPTLPHDQKMTRVICADEIT